MKKSVKIILSVIGGLIGLLVLAGILVPIIFKDDIKKSIDGAIAENVNARVEFDVNDFDISLFSNFPSLTVSMGDVAVIGIEEFDGDTLASFSSFSIALNLMDVIGGEMKINGIYLDSPKILGKVTKDGKANWDIAKATDEEEEVEEESSEALDLEIEEIIITNGQVIYDDQQGDMYAEMLGLNFEAGIKLGDVMVIRTNTKVNSLTYEMEGVPYVKQGEFESTLDLNAELEKGRYEFLNNELRLNNFIFGFDGIITATDDATSFENFTFGAKDTKFKSVLSLVPGVFMEGFEDLKTNGTFSFKGDANGSLTDTSIPEFNLGLNVKDGFVQYPDLPSSINDITFDLVVNNEDGKMQSTVVDLKEFSLDLAGNPFNFSLLLKFLNEEMSLYEVKAGADIKVDLAKILKVVPVEGLDLKGLFALKADISGVMSEEDAADKIPQVDVAMSLTNGFAKSSEVPVPIEDMHFKSEVHIPEDNLNGGSFLLDGFTIALAGEKFVANAEAQEFDDAAFKGDLSGVLDLDKILKVFPIDDMEMGGKFIVSEFFVAGRMSDIENEDYSKIKMGGGLDIENFTFKSEDVPQGVRITQSSTIMTPDKINIKTFEGFLGQSAVQANGYLGNYMGFGLGLPDSTIVGVFEFTSPSFDINEWMIDDEESSSTVEIEEEEPLEVIPIPTNIDFVLNSKLDKVIYDNMDINNLNGVIIVRDGAVIMKGVNFNMLDGEFEMDGSYDTKDPAHPTFSYDMVINGLAIKDAYSTFNTVQKLAPIAKTMSGKFNTDFKIYGELDQEMMPIYNTLNGGGIIDLDKAAVREVKAFEAIGKTLKIDDFNEIVIEKVKIEATIEDGTVSLKPFAAKAGNVDMIVSGKNSFEGEIDYVFDMELPSGAAGDAASNALSNAGVGGANIGETVPIKVGLTGSYENPKPKILSGGAKDVKENVKEEAKEAVTKEVEAVKEKSYEEYNKQLEEQAKNVIKESKIQANNIRKEGKSAAEELQKEGYAQATALENKGGNVFEKRANKELAKKLRSETDNKALGVYNEADKKAKSVESEGRKKADSILRKKK